MFAGPTPNPTRFQMRSSRRPRLILILLIALCGVFVYSYTSRLQEKTQVETQIAAMHAKIEQASNQQYKLLEELARVRAPDFLDHKARREFGLAMPGDIVLTVVQLDTSTGTPVQPADVAAAEAVVDSPGPPVWQQWMTLFTTEALRVDQP